MTAPIGHELTLSRGKLIGVIAGLVVAALVVAVALPLLLWSQRDQPEIHANIAGHFKYGSIGSEGRSGIPYWVWVVLPNVFEDLLPPGEGDGYRRLGFLYEDDPPKGRPIGTSYREKVVPFIGLNCAICHTGALQESADAPTRIVLGMPAHQFDLQRYLQFLFAVADDPRFTADQILPAIERANPDFGFFDRIIYRFGVIPDTKRGLQSEKRLFAWMQTRPGHGPGRVDTFNPYKLNIFGLPEDPYVGTADFPSLWNQAPREGLWLHWDGNNNSVEERNKSAAIGAGASEDSLDLVGMQRVADWISGLTPPEFPPDRIDWSRVAAGRQTYQANCAQCHDFDGADIGQVTPIDQIGTDRERLDSFTAELAARMNTLGTGQPWRFSHFRKTEGYSNQPLDGIWLRAPYLHNGSVPTLRDLLRPPEERPSVVLRGYDVYDFEDLGFVSSGAEAEQAGFRFETGERGNGEQGHVYGTGLSQQEKDDLLEYLKTR
jgi:mono/diheme cytochrome c family protein